MDALETIQIIKLSKTPDGTVHIGETRVALESVVLHFSLGATAEQIAQKFPSLDLAEVYGVISYFLDNHEKVAEYVLQQEIDSDKIQSETESKFQSEISALRKRILARGKKPRNILAV